MQTELDLDLYRYSYQELASGSSETELRNTLLGAGYREADISNIINIVANSTDYVREQDRVLATNSTINRSTTTDGVVAAPLSVANPSVLPDSAVATHSVAGESVSPKSQQTQRTVAAQDTLQARDRLIATTTDASRTLLGSSSLDETSLGGKDSRINRPGATVAMTDLSLGGGRGSVAGIGHYG